MKTVKIIRIWTNDKETIGTLLIIDSSGMPVFSSMVLERGDLDNKKSVSNIPAGIYPLKLTYSPRFKRKMWLVADVPNRAGIRIHPANYYNQLEGCLAPGIKLKDINKDGLIDVTSSRLATSQFESALRGISETTIEIVENY